MERSPFLYQNPNPPLCETIFFPKKILVLHNQMCTIHVMDPPLVVPQTTPPPPPPPPTEFQKLLQSLAMERGATNEPMHLYKGFWYSTLALEGVLASQQHFEAQDSDIILVTAPKSGTTWLKALTFAIMYRTQYAVSDQAHPLLTTNPHGLVPFIFLTYTPSQVTDVSGIPSPCRIYAEHSSYSMLPESIRTSKCRIIYLCRNPKDTFASVWHFAHKVSPQCLPLEEAFDKFCRGVSWFGPFWEQALAYWKLSLERPEEVLFLKFEDLKGDITSQLKKMAEFLGCSFSLKEEEEGVIEEIARMCSFDCLSSLEVNKTGERSISFVENREFFRKGDVGDWTNLLTPSMVERLDQLVEQKLHGTGLTFG